ncbi:MAG: winged helix-turn-helix transcriptional regulator [Bdellovibrionales bacterium]
MKKPKQNKDFPIVLACQTEEAIATRDFLSRIADKWSVLIVLVLSQQPNHRARFSDLKNGISGISQTMLTSTLRALERDGIVERELFPEVPPRVEYELTKCGLSVLEPMNALVNWVNKNWSTVKRSREAFDVRRKG